MSNNEILDALEQISREKNIDLEMVVTTLRESILLAVKKKYGQFENTTVNINDDTGQIEIIAKRTVVPTVIHPGLEISHTEAVKIKTGAAVGDVLDVFLPFDEFGRNAVLVAKQILIQRIREAERDRIYADFRHRKGDIVTGTISQIDRGALIVNLGKTEGILPPSEQSAREHFHKGSTIKALVLAVEKQYRGPQIVLSRRSPDFVAKLFEYEVPEIYEGKVIIRSIARDPGERCKIAVYSTEEKIDPVGACVGIKGLRVQNIVKELNNERIDIIPYDNDILRYGLKALGQQEPVYTHVNYGEKRILVVVEESKLSQAIGKNGQNVRLASRLVEWNIEVLGELQYREMKISQERERVDVERLKGVGPKLATNLRLGGFDSAQRILNASIADLCKVPGIGEKKAEEIIDLARVAVSEVRAELSRKAEEDIFAQLEAEKEALRAEGILMEDDGVSDGEEAAFGEPPHRVAKEDTEDTEK